MKKLFFLLIAGLSATFAQAQSSPKIGFKIGANYSNISGDLQHQNIYSNKLGFVGGITTSFPLASDGFISINPEILFSQKGYQYRDEEFTNTSGQRIKMKGDVGYNYIDVPVLLKVKAGGLFFEGGPLGSYLLGIKDNVETKVNDQSFERTTTVSKNGLTKFEVGYAAGVGYMLPVGVSLGVRYNGSISRLANDNNNNNLMNARHSLFQASLGYTLGGK
ncbi:porin family protein [Adhaeribacter aquaticus]|uniref:porin family protein n=1 Tax=Adhaeribacter aquaticus TaxID=299567 RepID=UPI00047CC77C|nr:porin family protein [Adhaeribacter aquaticus]